jgi:hypothetical protein
MNRIRQKGNKFQVLITPYKVGDDGLSELIGHWTDENIRNFYIHECFSMDDAYYIALNYPDLDWVRLYWFHKDIYADLYKKIKQDLDTNLFIYEIEPILLSGEQIKESMFDRVEMYGQRFSLSYNMNDVIGYHIVNPWSKNLEEIANILSSNKRLRIQRSEKKNGIIRLIGLTDLSTNYEIVLWPTILSQWAKWMLKNPHLPEKQIELSLSDAIKNQKII